MRSEIVGRIVDAWNEIANAPAGWTAGKITVVVSPGSRSAPPEWAGTIRLGAGSLAVGALITVPNDHQAARVRNELGNVAPDRVTDPESWGALLPTKPARVLGPAGLAYLDRPDFRPSSGGEAVEAVSLSDVSDAIAALEAAATQDEVDEAGITYAKSPLFVLWRGDTVAAACGYAPWVGTLAHLMVMTHPAHRGHGLAKRVASAASRHALDAGLIPQWRARVPASQAVARSLGYVTVGAQLSLRLDA
jgi:GNAT superfamily N-acetyltransferase